MTPHSLSQARVRLPLPCALREGVCLINRSVAKGLSPNGAAALQVCSQVALAAVDRSQSGPGAAGTSGSGAGFRGGLDESLMEGTANEEDETAKGPAASAAPKQPPALPEQGSLGSQSIRLGTAPRLRTRLFAAR